MRRLALSLAALASLAGAAHAEPRGKPNVLFVIADDLNKHLPCYGHPEVKAPNVDRLAAKATRFDRAYCQYPVCSPSRVSFLSGRRPEHTGVFGNDGPSRSPLLKDAVFLPEHFKANGYFTARVGKVFHIGRDVPECWDVSEEGTPGNAVLYQPGEIDKLGLRRAVKAEGKLTGGAGEGNTWAILDTPDDDLIDGRVGKRTAELIGGAVKAGKPFFVCCGFRRPHLPRIAPAPYFEQYPPDKIAPPPAPPVTHPAVKAAPSAADTREALRSYFACVSFMDAQLGKALDALDEHKLWDSTVVVLLGDHGYALGSRGGWWGKGLGYDEHCSTCLLVHAPGQARKAECKRVVEFLDLYPTLADLCGAPAPKGAEGRSLKPLLADPAAAWDHPAFSMTARNGTPHTLAVSTERFRLIQNYDGTGAAELYDVRADPNEWKNLAADPNHAADLKRLTKSAQEYRAKVAATGR